jgi:hypothetical protein
MPVVMPRGRACIVTAILILFVLYFVLNFTSYLHVLPAPIEIETGKKTRTSKKKKNNFPFKKM